MQRRDFLKSTVAVAVAAELGMGKAQAKVPAHNWGNFDYGSGPQVRDRLNQGPFPQYPPDAVIPTDDVDWSPISPQTVVRRKSNQTIFLRRSKTWFDFPWASSFMSVRPGGKCSHGPDAWSCPII